VTCSQLDRVLICSLVKLIRPMPKFQWGKNNAESNFVWRWTSAMKLFQISSARYAIHSPITRSVANCSLYFYIFVINIATGQRRLYRNPPYCLVDDSRSLTYFSHYALVSESWPITGREICLVLWLYRFWKYAAGHRLSASRSVHTHTHCSAPLKLR